MHGITAPLRDPTGKKFCAGHNGQNSQNGRSGRMRTVSALEAKIRGEQPTRGWGLFLAESMVDEVRTTHDPSGNTTELIVRLEEDDA